MSATARSNSSENARLLDWTTPKICERSAIVLQLDLCGFTELSQQMSAMDLAHALHSIFSGFDTSVQSFNFFKMDALGDAYIVAAFLSHEDRSRPNCDSSSATAQDLCLNMLALARSMLDTLGNKPLCLNDFVSGSRVFRIDRGVLYCVV
jgi:class 3 adenylate cyclase